MATAAPCASSIAFGVGCHHEKGIHYLGDSKYEKAISSFTKSLKLVMQLLNAQEEEQVEVHSNGIPISPRTLDGVLPTSFFHQPRKDCNSQHSTFTRHKRNNSFGFIFRNPIYFHSQDVEHRLCHKTYASLAYILLYNLALAHHLQAVDGTDGGGKSSQAILKKSLCLYQAAHSVEMKERIPLTIMQTMAIVNNVGHIHSAMQNANMANECFHRLLSAIMIIKDRGDEDSIQQLDGFLVNVTHLILVPSTAVAA